MLKKLYVEDIKRLPPGSAVVLPCWTVTRRKHGQIAFFTLADSTGSMQATLEASIVGQKAFDSALAIAAESSAIVEGTVGLDPLGGPEIQVLRMKVVGGVSQQISPLPRSPIDITDPRYSDHLTSKRHLYLRNPAYIEIMRFRSELLTHMRHWFEENGFVSFDAPILTPAPLYEDGSAMPIVVHEQDVFLTQCVGYYLEAAAHALERVYNIGPSFRGEESRSRRHLMEYWHIKAEAAWGDLEDVIGMVESIIAYLAEHCKVSGQRACATLGTTYLGSDLHPPFPRVKYRDAIRKLQAMGQEIEFGKSLGSEEEELLSREFEGPFWIEGIPRSIEPFPYAIDPNDPEVTRVADLIASQGYGELLGVAEKAHTFEMLQERMTEKGRENDPRFEFIREVHRIGGVPHVAFGMGLERLIRWLLNIPHVRDAVAFPRTFRRTIAP